MIAAFVALGTATRIGLAVFNADPAAFAPLRLAGWLLLGGVFDLGAGVWLALPFALAAWLLPDTPLGRRLLAAVALLLGLVAAAALVFSSAAEFVFWNEFGTRFNFIAVDYLLYTSEVIGNIRQSYPLPLLLSAVGAASVLVFGAIARPLLRASQCGGQTFRSRSVSFAVIALLPAMSAGLLDARYHEFSDHAPSSQLAGNGPWEFVHAFVYNEIDYARFYRTLGAEQADATLRQELAADGSGAVPASGRPAFERDITGHGAEKRLNVVLISVESLSADFLGSFGNAEQLTPRLDALANDGLLFTRLYATGTRTVRGLEALTLSLPPTPGHSVVKRPDNGNLFTLGSVFADRGYEPIYLYGGYSYFDNMQAFFGGNGYTVIDRSRLAKEEISYENIWGVADEDLFKLALREIDARHAAGRHFFAHVMTTSNHRPFSYPAGRIDLPAGSRNGAVKYTDWAIGEFIAQARRHPWFDDTVFVIVADHCASSRGKTDLPLDRFHIPLLVYAPKHVAPGRVDTLASQIDVAPTLLALLNFSYHSTFFGQDILTAGRQHPRALLANYQTVGYLQDGALVELRPKARVRVLDAASGIELPDDARRRRLIDEAIAYYQTASAAFHSGALRRRGTDASLAGVDATPH